MNPQPLPTKDRILDAAETLFADLGFQATSLRALTQAAGVNLAAVNYHFQSKEALLLAVIGRHASRVNARRFQLLDELERDGKIPAVQQVLEAFFRPVLEQGPLVPRLMMRVLYLEPEGTFREVFSQHLREVAGRFRAALTRALPQLQPEQLLLRVIFVTGAFAQAMTARHAAEVIAEGRVSVPDQEKIFREFLRFAAAGMSAAAGPSHQEAS